MHVEALSIAGAMKVAPRVFSDERGYFKEVFAASRYADAGINESFVQDNISVSCRLTLRGLHADQRMSKLVQVLRGRAFDVLVDVRRDSPTFGKWEGFILDAQSHVQVYIPAGCLHGFLSLEDDTMLSYKQSAQYDPTSEIGVAWNDPDIAIAWPLEGAAPLLSPKDEQNLTLRMLGYF
jgi:dTDP-4-dehydrorhamnose 3,5-epimerase